MQYCSKADVGCATLVMEQLCFEMCREFTQTKLQLLLSPILLMVPSSPNQVCLQLFSSDRTIDPTRNAYISDHALLVVDSTLSFCT